MTDAYIVGVDMIKFSRFPDKTVPQIGAQAALMALDDCGLTIQDMQALYCGNLGQASGMVGQRLQGIGQASMPVVNVANACLGDRFPRSMGFGKAGLHDCVLAVGVEQMVKACWVAAAPKSEFPRKACRLRHHACGFHRPGRNTRVNTALPSSSSPKVSVKNHHHPTLNPKAMYQIETPLPEVMNAEMISYPNTKLMCSVNMDGSAAAVICSERKRENSF